MLHIIIHTLPYELNALEQTLIQLKRSSKYLTSNEKVRIEVLLNANLIDWSNSVLNLNFFSSVYHDLIKLNEDWAECVLKIDDKNEFLGCNDLRRYTLRNTDANYVMYLDTDVIFNDTLLRRIFDSLSIIPDEHFILTPQLTRMWDTTWDVVSNEKFFNEASTHENYLNRDPYKAISDNSEVNLKPIQGFKFAGWGTIIPTKLGRFIDIPDSLGSYGLDDTFIMFACDIMNKHGYNVKQYVIEGELVIENNKFRLEYFKDFLTLIDRKEEFTKQAHNNFHPELTNFNERLSNLSSR